MFDSFVLISNNYFRRDVAQSTLTHEMEIQQLRKKSANIACELSDRIDQGLRHKQKLEKEKAEQKQGIND